MKYNKIAVVFKKELLETLRDRRSMVAMILIPIVLYPLMFIVMSQMITFGGFDFDEKMGSQVTTEIPNSGIAAGNEKTASSETVSPTIPTNDEFPVPETLGASTLSSAPETSVGGMIFGSLVPVLLIVTLIFGALYPAIDLTAGEKERGTLETILTVPISRVELLFGKYLTVSTFALMTGVLNLISMLMTYSLGLIQMGALTGDVQFSLTPAAMIILFISLIPLSLFISSTIISVCIFARSFKEAQNLVTPFYLLLIFPALFALAPGMKLSSMLSLIPVLNVSLLFKEVLFGHYPMNLIFSVFLSNALFAFIGITVVSKLFNAEDVLFTEGKGWQFLLRRSQIIPTEVFHPSSVFIIYAIIAFLLFYVGSTIQAQYKHWGILATQWLLIFLPVLAFGWYNKVDLKKTLHLKRFHPLDLVGTIFLAIAGIAVTTWVARFQIMLFPETIKIGKVLEKIMNFESLGVNSFLGIFIFAISPAICEELLFRGAMLSSLKKRMSPLAAMTVVAFMFGIFHIYLFRILPTAILGFYLAFIVYRTGSVYLGMIGHALNNSFALLVISNPRVRTLYGHLAGESQYLPIVILAVIGFILFGTLLILKFDGKPARSTN